MNPQPALPRSTQAPILRTVAGLLLALALALTGCATRRQVADIVAQSNAAMLAASLGLPDPAQATAGPPAWRAESDRIDGFIEAHPGRAATTAPLRLRQAMLFLAHHEFSLAAAAFNAVDLADLHSDRDQALKRSQGTLLWWFASSTNHTWTAADQAQAQTALRQLKDEQDRLAQSPAIRDYLAEMRAWIGLSAARQSTSTNRMRERLEDTLNTYAAIFTAADLAAISRNSTEPFPEPQALGADVRRRLRARALLDAARDLNTRHHLAVHPAAPAFDHYLNSP